jgi:acyl-CoA thioesterase FadM
MNVGGELYADGEAKVVFIDASTQKPLRIPERFRALLT